VLDFGPIKEAVCYPARRPGALPEPGCGRGSRPPQDSAAAGRCPRRACRGRDTAGRFEITTIEAAAGSIAITAALTSSTAFERDPGSLSVVVRPNRSLSPAMRQRVAIAMCVPVAAIALGAAVIGGWWVLPFAGVEIALILTAAQWLAERDGDFEAVEIAGSEVQVRRSVRGRTSVQRFNADWVRLVVLPAGIARKGALALRSHGRLHPIGEHMTEAERSAAARLLARHLRCETLVGTRPATA
jgi:uncharacterized membrane protein